MCILVVALTVDGFTNIRTRYVPRIINIPLKIWTTWHTKDLPPKMQENSDLVQRTNQEFEYNLFDDQDCRDYIIQITLILKLSKHLIN